MSAVLARLAAFTVLWWIVSDGSPESFVLGAPAVTAATWLSWGLREPGSIRVSPSGLVRFIGYFAWESLKGGLDVAARALAPAGRVQPGYVHHRTALPAGVPRLLLTCTVSLLPGTLSVAMEGDELVIHALAMDQPALAGIIACEQHIARVFATTVPTMRTEQGHA